MPRRSSSLGAFHRRARASLAAGALAGAPLAAQVPTVERLSPAIAPRWASGVALDVARPVGDLRRHVADGWGVAGHVAYGLDRAGVLSMRADAGRLAYGRTRSRVAVASDAGARATIELETSNDVWWFGVGPQLAVPAGPLRPYAGAQVGAVLFRTTATRRAEDDRTVLARGVAQDDAALAWAAGGGVLVPLGRRAALDVGARYRRAGQVAYVPDDGVRTGDGGEHALELVRGPAALWAYRAGLTVRFDARDLGAW
jgi:opacity protein-like surface antigen